MEAVLEAAARIVRRGGLAALNTNRIAERAGVSVGTLYGYFPDKTAILAALARRIMEEDHRAVLDALDADAAGEPIRSVVRALIARHRADRALRGAVMGVHIGQGGGGEHGEQVERVVASLLARGEELFGGRAPPDRLRMFVATRAALGVVRALAEDGAAAELPDAAIEDEVVRIIHGCLGFADPRAAGAR